MRERTARTCGIGVSALYRRVGYVKCVPTESLRHPAKAPTRVSVETSPQIRYSARALFRS